MDVLQEGTEQARGVEPVTGGLPARASASSDRVKLLLMLWTYPPYILETQSKPPFILHTLCKPTKESPR